jgi:hypothetical protein
MAALSQVVEETTITDLVEKYLEAKADEAKAERRRVELGILIAAALGKPDEGSKTHAIDGYSVKVTQPINRKVEDWSAFDAVLGKHPGEPAPVKVKRELDAAGVRWLLENSPEFYRELAKHIVATPGRVQVEVKEAPSK